VSQEVNPPRSYTTTLRQEQARLTRERILDAARRLFTAGGFAEITMHDIAREAGVAYQTVYSQFGNKLQLALELCASEFPHVGETVAMLEKARTDADPDAWIGVMGAFARRLYGPCAEILRFMRESGDPELLRRYGEIKHGLYAQLAELGPQLEKVEHLRPGLTGAEAVDLGWTLASPETYQHLVLDRRWTPERFEGWLREALAELVLRR
jgi:AcrR family transcriptional regulator